MIVMREIVNAKQTQVHPGNPSQGWLRRLCLSALSLPGRIVALPEWPRLNCRFEANALIEQGFGAGIAHISPGKRASSHRSIAGEKPT